MRSVVRCLMMAAMMKALNTTPWSKNAWIYLLVSPLFCCFVCAAALLYSTWSYRVALLVVPCLWLSGTGVGTYRLPPALSETVMMS